ncbi:glycosyltransferase family 2 protein [Aminobacter sp. HY435]|uniref:glycosyltransferase family 2 protein n=1 Tax=Aminobacter sp. HY435 TaxID=2970917 RepID=UPI0022B94E30|nr:glycosyltransferase [Aminobacter sp. HY435]
MASVDVVVPCYNYGRFIGDCVTSVLDQRGVDLRVLIIDNASQDDSLDIARKMAARDSRVEVVAHSVNRGATYSYNEGIDLASGDYMLILDADDMLAPGALGRAVAVLDNDPSICFAHGDEGRLEAGGAAGMPGLGSDQPAVSTMTGTAFIRQLCRMPVNHIGANTVVRRTSVQKQIGHYRPSLPYTDDLEMWLRLATAGNVARISEVQAIRRYHDTRMSVHYQSRQARDFIERERAFKSFFDHEGRRLADVEALAADVRRGLGQHAYWSAVSHLLRGHGGNAIEIMRLSHHWRPNAVLTPPLSWLFRMDRPFGRAVEVLSEAVAPRSNRI